MQETGLTLLLSSYECSCFNRQHHELAPVMQSTPSISHIENNNETRALSSHLIK